MTKAKASGATFDYHGLTVRVRRMTVRDVLHSEVVIGSLSRLRPTDQAWGVNQFARFWASVEHPGDDAFPVPPLDLAAGDKDEADARILTAYEAFLNADGMLVDGWSEAYRTANEGKGDTGTGEA